MKILVVSDSHLYENVLERITKLYKGKVDVMIHCGDSSLPLHDSCLKNYDVVVKGNHDDAPFPEYGIYQDIYVVHGHLQHVYLDYDDLIDLCHLHHCHLCFHGHTHIPTHQVIDNIHFINPGSLMINRASYGFGTYAIVHYEKSQIRVDYYHHITDQHIGNHILEEGEALLKEFQKNARKR